MQHTPKRFSKGIVPLGSEKQNLLTDNFFMTLTKNFISGIKFYLKLSVRFF